jgi:hypothetical protein
VLSEEPSLAWQFFDFELIRTMLVHNAAGLHKNGLVPVAGYGHPVFQARQRR